jgi:hypothetical protein
MEATPAAAMHVSDGEIVLLAPNHGEWPLVYIRTIGGVYAAGQI